MRFRVSSPSRRRRGFFAELRERKALRKSLPTLGVLNQEAEWPGYFPQVYLGVLGGFGVGHAVWAGRTYRVVTMFGKSQVRLLPLPLSKAEESRRAFRKETKAQRWVRGWKFDRLVEGRSAPGVVERLRDAWEGRNLTRDKFKKAGVVGGGLRGVGIAVRAENRKRKPVGRHGGGKL